MKWSSDDILYHPFVRNHLSCILVGFVLGVLIYVFIDVEDLGFGLEFFLSGFLGIFVVYMAVYLSKLLDDLISWERNPGTRLLIGVLSHLALGIFFSFAALWFYSKLFLDFSILESDENSTLLKIEILLFFTALIYNIFYFTFYSYNQYAKGQVSKQKYKRKQKELQFEALKSQLSPHFLFNSMNVVSSLIHKNTDAAESFIRSLAKSYQYVLKQYGVTLVKVEDEVAFLKTYASLMKIRFGDSFNLDIELPKTTLATKIPPMTLQMLVENAIKHNSFDITSPLVLNVKEEDGFICVLNNRNLRKLLQKSTKLGLNNIAERYSLITSKEMEVIDDSIFQVRLPVLI